MVSFSQYQELPPLLDSHIHLTHATNGTYPEHFRYFTNSASPDGWSSILAVDHKSVFSFLGIHPECGSGPIDDIGWEKHLRNLEGLVKKGTMGIGECGIDNRYYQSFTKFEQYQLLLSQMKIAEKYMRPITLHNVHAAEMIISLLKKERLSTKFMLHGFYGSRQTAKRLLDLGGFLSISPNLLRSEEKFKQLVSYIPTDRILIETDYPYTYIPSEWEDYSYAEVLYTWYDTIAQVRAIDIHTLLDIVLSNGTIFTNTPLDRRPSI